MAVNRKSFDTLIIGLGKTGMSCVRYLANRDVSSFAVVDSREHPPELSSLNRDFPEVPLYLGSFHEEIISAAGRLIVSPGVSLEESVIRRASDNGVKIINDIEIFCREAAAPVIAVTGSNGKSTVATLVTEMINQAGKRALLGGNIGTPALDLLNEETPDYYVLELSSFQLEPLASLNATASAVLNISEDHMDRYSDIHQYAEVKKKIYAGNGLMVINLDDPLISEFDRNGRRTSLFTLNEPDEGIFGLRNISGRRCLAYGTEEICPVSSIKLHGDHNLSNCMAALALAGSTGLSTELMVNALVSFSGLPHRCQWVARKNGVDWYNDSKGTNVGASCAAIKGLCVSGPVILIAGGTGKGADFSRLAEMSAAHCRHVILLGRDADLLAQAMAGLVPFTKVQSMGEAVQTAARVARAGEAVLLSPACASFDMFENYEERGRTFRDLVQALKH